MSALASTLRPCPADCPQVCYSWWCLSALAILGRLHWIDQPALTRFILDCQVRVWWVGTGVGGGGRGWVGAVEAGADGNQGRASHQQTALSRTAVKQCCGMQCGIAHAQRVHQLQKGARLRTVGT